MVFEIRRYILERLYFPRVLSIDKPGIILHKKLAVFGGRNVVTRSIFVFEDIYVDLFLNTLHEIGVERTSDLWYRIGKEVMFRYLEFYKGAIKNKKNIRKMIDYFSKHFSGVGMSVFNNYKLDFDKGVFEFSGSNSVICRNFFNASYLAGAISGMLSFLFDKNVEAKQACFDCPKGCKIIADFSYDKKYIVTEEVKIRNFVRPVLKASHSFSSRLSSFYDFLKFGIVNIDNDKKFSFKEKSLIPVEIGLPTIFFLNYEREGLREVYEESIISSSEKLASEILSNQKDIPKKILAIRNVVSAFGLGEPFISKQGNMVKINFINPFFVRNPPSMVQYFFNGVLNYIYGKKLVVDSVGSSGIQYSFKES